MTNPENFNLMEYGFKDFQGNTWFNSLVDLYNKFTLEMKREYQPHSPLYEQIADSRHKLFFIASKAQEA